MSKLTIDIAMPCRIIVGHEPHGFHVFVSDGDCTEAGFSSMEPSMFRAITMAYAEFIHRNHATD